MERRNAHRLVPGARRGQSPAAARGHAADLRHGAVRGHVAQGQGAGAQALPGLEPEPVHAGRTGRADLRRQDRHPGARHGLQVLRLDPGDRRGAPRRGLQPPAAQVRRRLSDHRAPAGADRPGAARQPLGHDLSRHAGGDRGPGPGRLPADARQRPEPAGGGRQRLCHAGRDPATSPSAAWPCATTIRSSPRPSATSARNSCWRPATSCATASTRWRCGAPWASIRRPAPRTCTIQATCSSSARPSSPASCRS